MGPASTVGGGGVAAVGDVGGVFEEHPRDLDFFSPVAIKSRRVQAGLAHRGTGMALSHGAKDVWVLVCARIQNMQTEGKGGVRNRLRLGKRGRNGRGGVEVMETQQTQTIIYEPSTLYNDPEDCSMDRSFPCTALYICHRFFPSFLILLFF